MADEQRLREELAQHLDALTAEFERQGMSPDAARRAARVKLGGEDQIRWLWREARRFAWLDLWARDLRLAARSLRRSTGYAAAVIITLALAIAANVAIFSVTDALLLRPLPYSHPRQLMMAQGTSQGFSGISYPQFRAWRDRNHSFSGMAAWGGAEGVLTGDGQAAQLTGEIVSANLFSLLGAQPFAGRFFRKDEDSPHADGGLDPIVISHKLFESRFDGNPAALGRTLTLSGKEYVLVGVTALGFAFPPAAAEDYWITAASWAEPKAGLTPATQSYSTKFLLPIARLLPGVSAAQATRDLDAISAALRQQHHEKWSYSGARVSSFRQTMVASLAPELELLWAGAGLVLLLACANLAGLGVARGMAQLPALRTRVALGARPRDLLRTLLGESVLLAIAGGAAGVALAWPVISQLAQQMDLPLFAPALDGRVLAYTAGLGIAALLLMGCWPAWAATRGALSRKPHSAQRSRSALVVAEVAIALVLVAAAGLLGRTLYRMASRDPGFNPHKVLTAHLTLPDAMPLARRPEVLGGFLDRVRGLPGVVSASAGFQLPWSGNWDINSIKAAAGTPISPHENFMFDVVPVTPGYFRSLGMHVLHGRGFLRSDSAQSPPIVIVNQRFLAKLHHALPSLAGPMLGKTVEPYIGKVPPRTIVGVVADVVMPGTFVHPALYLPYAQWPNIASLAIAVRVARGDPMALLPAVRHQLAAVNPDLALGDAQPLTAYWSNWGAQPEAAAAAAGTLGLLALLLAATGLYGLVAYSVRQRERELGVRVALGARCRDLYTLILSMGLRLTAIGLVIGGVGIYFVRGALASQLYGLSALDPLTLTAAVLVLAAVGLAACWLPARRAAHADPIRVLRAE